MKILLYIIIVIMLSSLATAFDSDVYYKLEDLTEEDGGKSLQNNNAAVFKGGILGDGINLVGGSQQSLNVTGVLTYTTEFTMALWANTTRSGEYLTLIFTITDATHKFAIRSFAATRRIQVYSETPATTMTTTDPCYADNEWVHYVVRHNASHMALFCDGVEVVNTADTSDFSGIIDELWLGRDGPAGGGYLTGQIDDLSIFPFAQPTQWIVDRYNGGDGSELPVAVPPVVTFVNQTPDDIDILNIMNETLEIYYNITSDEGLDNTTIILKHFINSSDTTTPRRIINGTSIIEPEIITFSSFLMDIFRWNLDDGDIYPASYNIDEDVTENEPHLVYSINSGSKAVKLEILNVSLDVNTTVLEVMVNSSALSILDIYYCNATYSTGDFTSSGDCALFSTINSLQEFNHTHNSDTIDVTVSSHHVIPVNIINKSISGVTVTNQSFFIFNPINNQIWDFHYVPNKSRSTAFENSNNLGNTWTEISGTLDAHLHQFTNTDFFNYQVCANDTGDLETCSSWRSDAIGLLDLPPSSPIIIQPNASAFSSELIINYTKSLSVTTSIDNYNISLADTSGTPISTIKDNNGVNLNFTWDTSSVSDGNYTILVTAIDSKGAIAIGVSDEFRIDNAIPMLTIHEPLLNLTVYRNDTANFTYTCQDDFLFGTDITIKNTTNVIRQESIRNIDTTTFRNNITMNFTNMSDGVYEFIASCFDSHTGESIRDLDIEIKPTGIIIEAFDINIDEVSDITYKKDFDRYTFTLGTKTDKKHRIVVSSDNYIYQIKDSPYSCHLVTDNYWFDCEPYKPDSIRRLTDKSFEIMLTGKDFNFNSVGILNNETKVNTFVINRVIDTKVTWKSFLPDNNTQFFNETSLSFRFNYTNDDSNNSICTLFRDNINISFGEFAVGFNNITDSSVPVSFDGNFSYILNCFAFGEDKHSNTTLKNIGFLNNPFVPAPKTIAESITDLVKIIIVVFFFVIHLVLVYLGFKFRVMAFSFVGGVLGVVSALAGLSLLASILNIVGTAFFISYTVIATIFMFGLIPQEKEE